MKLPHLLVLGIPMLLVSCIEEFATTDSYRTYATPAPGYYGSYGGYRPGYYQPGYSRPYYSGGYYNNSYTRRDCDDYDDKHKSSSKKSSSDRDIRLVDYDQNRKRGDLPDGYHSPEWFKSRGYSLSQNTYKNRDGDVKGKAANQKKSSSKNKKH